MPVSFDGLTAPMFFMTKGKAAYRSRGIFCIKEVEHLIACLGASWLTSGFPAAVLSREYDHVTMDVETVFWVLEKRDGHVNREYFICSHVT